MDTPYKSRYYKPADGVDIWVYKNPNKILINAGNQTLTFIWLSRTIATGNLDYSYAYSQPNPITNFQWNALKATDPFDSTVTTTKFYSYPSPTTFGDLSMAGGVGSADTRPINWYRNDKAQSVILRSIPFANATEAAYYGVTGSATVVNPTNPNNQAPYLVPPSTAKSWNNSANSVYGRAFFYKGVFYVMPSTSPFKEDLFQHNGYNTYASCAVSVVSGSIYYAFVDATTQDIYLSIYTLIPPPITDLYGTCTFTTTKIYSATATDKPTDLIFSDVNPTILFVLATDPTILRSGIYYTTNYITYKLDIGTIATPIKTPLWAKTNPYPEGSVYALFDWAVVQGVLQATVGFSESISGGTNLLHFYAVSVSQISTAQEFVAAADATHGTVMDVLYSQASHGVYVYIDDTDISGTVTRRLRVRIAGVEVYAKAMMRYSVPTSPVDVPLTYNTYARLGDKLMISVSRRQGPNTYYDTTFPDILHIDITKSIVTEVPQVISGISSQVHAV
jgi:hypothetical protein